jgi:hypothetical protein
MLDEIQEADLPLAVTIAVLRRACKLSRSPPRYRINEASPMRFDEWEVTIQKIIDECKQEQKTPDTVLAKWRATLAKEPNLLQSFQIDQIVREVRRRLSSAND